MKSKVKTLLALLMVCILVLSMAACGEKKEAPAPADDTVYTLQWAHSSPPENDRLGDSSKEIIAKIEKESNGRLKFDYYPANQLGAERDTLEGVSLGTVDLAVISSGPTVGFFPEIAVSAIPYILTDRETAWAVYDGPFGQKLAADMEAKTGMKVLGWAENGFRTFSNNKHEVKNPADMKGLKIRTMENEFHMAMVNDMGASAIPVTFAELYTALSQGTVDGQENGLALTYNNKLYEKLKYITLDYHVYDPYVVAMSSKAWNSLPADLQELLQANIKDFIALERQYNIRDDERCLQAMKDAGLQVYEPTEADFAAFKASTAGVIDKVKAKIGPEIVDEYLAAVEATKK